VYGVGVGGMGGGEKNPSVSWRQFYTTAFNYMYNVEVIRPVRCIC
jgi:hypothetical protein